MTESKQHTFIAEIDIRYISPEILKTLEGRLVAEGPSPDEAIATLRTQLEGVLQNQGVYVREGTGFTEEEKELITALRIMEKMGATHVEGKKLLEAWSMQQEAAAEAVGTREAQIAFERRRAVLYWNAGLHEAADQAWEDALMIAQQEGKGDLCQEILDEINAFLVD